MYNLIIITNIDFIIFHICIGIIANDIPITEMKYLTRLHYWAADVVTHGPLSPWGEHEIDYILFIKINKEFSYTANPEEVMNTRWVTYNELSKMMTPGNGLRWSPWFRMIAEKDGLLKSWWENLDETLTTDKYVDYDTIHRFNPTEEHMGIRHKGNDSIRK
jgi:isopentenyldiphosphate isomerase